MRKAAKGWFVALGLLVSGVPARAYYTPAFTPDPDIPAQVRALFDKPISVQHKLLPKQGDDTNPAGVVRCFTYPGFLVKEIDTGQIGDDAISVTPLKSSTTAPGCSDNNEAGEIVLKSGQGHYFVGAKGNFMLLDEADGDATLGFLVIDSHSGRMIYSDHLWGLGVSGLSIASGTLTMKYQHAAETGCSIVTGGQKCWTQLAKDASLPKAVASQAVPIAVCKAAYAAAKLGPDAASPSSVISYPVIVTLTEWGVHKVLSRGSLHCSPG